MEKKIIFRADGNSSTGLGHLYRLFALVEMLKDNYDFIFLTKENSTNNVIPKSYLIKLIPNNIDIRNEPNWLVNNFSPNEYIIIADGYHFVSSYQQSVKNKGFDLIYIDDLNKEKMFADVVINHAPAIDNEYQISKDTKLALGTKYALLRPAFLKEAIKTPVFNTIHTAFVCFGGSDKYNLSLIATQALLEIDRIGKVYVVLGAAYTFTELIDLAENNSKIHIIKNASELELLEVMKESNFAIAPASTILYELCCVKMPILSGYYVANQKNIYHQLVEKNIVFEGNDFSNYSKVDFLNKTLDIIKSNDIETKLIQQHKFFDGKSKNRILGLVNSLHISFEKVTKKHLNLVFEWSNDKLVRDNSYQSKAIVFEQHIKWFDIKINNKATLFLIVLVNNQPAGIVRYEVNNNSAIVGVLIQKRFRGQGLASDFLIKSASIYFKKFNYPIFAYIKKTNVASIKTFKNANYSYFKDELVNGINSFVYKLEKNDFK